jgi:NADPH:quinone reductase-like Zn-dependent oxidoreductase
MQAHARGFLHVQIADYSKHLTNWSPLMKAVVIHSFGNVDVLKLEDLPMPVPQADEVLVRVNAASVNPVDYKTRSGKSAVKQNQLPMVLGRDVAGIVEQCGSAATHFRKGSEVYALLDREHGGYAEYVIVKERDLATKPAQLDFIQAAAVPMAAVTAWQGLFDHGNLKAGQHVLIHGGAGGVGHLAVQCAKARGARVSTTASKQDLEFVRSLGADQVIDKAEDFEDSVRDVDLVFDLVNGETQDRSWAVLKQGGTMVSTLTKPSAERAKARGARAEHYMAQPDAAELDEIGVLIDSGKVRPHVAAVFRLTDVGAAQQQLETKHNRGKIVLRIGS